MKKSTTLFEDTTMAYNRWVSGIAKGEFKAQSMGISSVLDNKRAKPLPGSCEEVSKNSPLHPALNNAPQIVGDILLGQANLRNKVLTALNSNLANNPVKKQKLLQIKALIAHNDRMTRRLVKAFDQLS